MPWDETNCMNERVKFIGSYLEAGEPFRCLCERFQVSRKTGYKWVARYETDGVAGLEERSRAPVSHPHAVADHVVEKILRIRKKHPRWGPRKVRVLLQRHYPQLALPAASTIGEVLRKNGLIQKRRRIRRSSPYRQRCAVLDSCTSRTVQACRLTDAQHLEVRDGQTAPSELPSSATGIRPVP